MSIGCIGSALFKDTVIEVELRKKDTITSSISNDVLLTFREIHLPQAIAARVYNFPPGLLLSKATARDIARTVNCRPFCSKKNLFWFRHSLVFRRLWLFEDDFVELPDWVVWLPFWVKGREGG